MRNLQKKIFSLIVAFTLIFTTLPFTVGVEASTYQTTGYQVTGYQDIEVDDSNFVVEREETKYSNEKALPSSYLLPELGLDTSVKNQNPYGTCWTFATMASAEGSVLKSDSTKDVDFSELQLAYFLYNRSDDPLHLTTGDTNIALDSSTGKPLALSSQFNLGGNMYLASVGIAGGLGFIAESLLPYSKATSVSLGSLPDSKLCYESNSYILNSAYWLSMSDRTTVKEVLMNEGSIGFSIYYDSSYYNSKNAAHYCYTIGTGTNHAVTIVGWDDSYSRENFGSSLTTRPLLNGAWLVKNSWGSSWGNNGYFWVSYYDLSIGSLGIKLCVEENEKDYDIYQYDGTTGVETIADSTKTASAANIYEAQNDSYLDRVGYFASKANTSYTISIYTDLTSESDPLSGTLALQMSGTDTYAGYHTVSLDKYVKITKGSKFSVVVKQSVSSGYITLVIDCNTSYGWIKFVNVSKENESFFAFGDDKFACKSYESDGSNQYYTARIKAFAIDIPEFEYSKKDETCLQKYNGTGIGAIAIPSNTVSISDDIFNGIDTITSMLVPEGVKTIGKNFCKDCKNLKTVTMPDSVESVGEGAFSGTTLTELNISEAMTVTDVEAKDPECEVDGATIGYHYALCENLKIVSETIDKLNHDFDNYKSNRDATFTEDGTKTSKCSRCEKYDTIDDVGSMRTPTELSLKTIGYRKYYHIGDNFDIGTTVIVAKDGDEYLEEKAVDDTMFTGFDSTTSGEKTLTYTLYDTEATDTITVVGYDLGDVDGSGEYDDQDAIRLLMNLYFPEDYPINQPGDFDMDGEYTDADAVYLLMNTFFPEEYPIMDWWTVESRQTE